MTNNRGYTLEPVFGFCPDVKKAMDLMIGCEILEVRQNRSRNFVETEPNNIELLSIYEPLNEEESDFVDDCIDSIKINIDSPSMLLERKSDKKHFVVHINPIFQWWTIFEVIYE